MNRKDSDSNQTTEDIRKMFIEQPTENDILCGKDKSFSKHKGSQMFRDAIMSNMTEYRMAAGKPDRMRLTKRIVDTLKEQYNARFLRLVELGDDMQLWEEISDQQARDKISHALRFALTKEDNTIMKKNKALAPKKQQRRYRRRASVASCASATRKITSKRVSKKRPPIGLKTSSDSEDPISDNTRVNEQVDDSVVIYNTLSTATDHSYDDSVSTAFSTDTSGVGSTDTDAVSTFSLAEDEDSITCLFHYDSYDGFASEEINIHYNRSYGFERMRLSHSDHCHNFGSYSDLDDTIYDGNFSILQQGAHSSPGRLGGDSMVNTIFACYETNEDNNVDLSWHTSCRDYDGEHHSLLTNHYHHGADVPESRMDSCEDNHDASLDLDFFDEVIDKDWDSYPDDNDTKQPASTASGNYSTTLDSYYNDSGRYNDPHGLYEL